MTLMGVFRDVPRALVFGFSGPEIKILCSVAARRLRRREKYV